MMAGHWSSQQVVQEYRETQATAMAVDASGRLAILAGRRSLTMVNLDQVEAKESVKKISRQSKWEVSSVQWNPHISHAHLFVTACNMRSDLWSWREGQSHQLGSLKAHTRVISDVDWSPVEANTLATCSVDTFTHIWDTRDIRKPALSLQAVSGASQVKWNKVNSHLVATAHDGDIRIWDPRRGTSPVQYIAAHLAKIHGLDWNPHDENALATSSQDCTVKLWDMTSPKQPVDRVSASACPVWRARYTPYGRGLVTVVVPQLRRGENSLFLWHLNNLKQPVHTFVGHTDVVLEFQWRTPSPESTDLQLVTWSKDQSLRLWRVDPSLQKLAGHTLDQDPTAQSEDGVSVSGTGEELSVSTSQPGSTSPASPHIMPGPSQPISISPGSSGATLEPGQASTPPRKVGVSATPPGSKQGGSREEVHSPHQPPSLRQEFTLVNLNIPNINVQQVDAGKRVCTVSAASSHSHHTVSLTMHFPQSYPHNAAPDFSLAGTSLSLNQQNKLVKILQDTAVQHVRFNRSCIEPCLRQLVTSLDHLTQDERRSPDGEKAGFARPQGGTITAPGFLPLYSFGAMQDASVPFPRTSGARFSAAGFLVCFTRRAEFHRRTSSAADLTPRAMSALSAYAPAARTPQGAPSAMFSMFGMARSPPTDNQVSLHKFYTYKDAPPTRTTKRARSRSRVKDGGDSGGGHTGPDKSNSGKKTGSVIIYNIACLMPLNQQLARDYVLDTSDVPAMCNSNARLAAAVGRRDLAQVWSICAVSAAHKPSPDPDTGAPWAMHPFGRKMINTILNQYSALYDVQTLAMLTCALGDKYQPGRSDTGTNRSAQVTHKSPAQQSVQHATTESLSSSQTDSSLSKLLASVPKVKRSNSWSEDLCEDVHTDTQSKQQRETEQHNNNIRLLDVRNTARYDEYKRAYADILYRWGLLEQRAQVLKYMSAGSADHDGLVPVARCQSCDRSCDTPACPACNEYVVQCAICRLPVKGSSSFCFLCGHGGHTQHLIDWFTEQTVCPTGCGCQCLAQNED